MRLIRLRVLGALLVMALCSQAEPPVKGHSGSSKPKIWMQVEETIVPFRKDLSRHGEIIGYATQGQYLVFAESTENWVKVKANDTLEGWVPRASLSFSGPPVIWDPETVKTTFLICAGLGMGLFLYLLASLERKRRRQNQTDARKRRLQNKIHLLFRSEPRIPSRLAMEDIDLMEYLQSIGYVVTLEKDPDNFLASCKLVKPNLVLAGWEFQAEVEAAMEKDAVLINTPVVYLQCETLPVSPKNLIRAYLEKLATDKDLGDTISLCLKKSPEKIRHSIVETALKGAIYPGTLIELFHFLASVKKTGKLLVQSGTHKSEVQFLLGNITKAKHLTLTETKAVEAILDCDTGTFEFHDRDPVADGNAGLNTEKILLDWARTRDENKHHPRA